MSWAEFLGAFLGGLLGALATVLVGEGKRRREEDTSLHDWVTRIYGWVVEGALNQEQARVMLESRRVKPRWWKFNRRYADRIDSILDGLDEAFTPPEPPTADAADEVFELREDRLT